MAHCDCPALSVPLTQAPSRQPMSHETLIEKETVDWHFTSVNINYNAIEHGCDSHMGPERQHIISWSHFWRDYTNKLLIIATYIAEHLHHKQSWKLTERNFSLLSTRNDFLLFDVTYQRSKKDMYDWLEWGSQPTDAYYWITVVIVTHFVKALAWGCALIHFGWCEHGESNS